MSSCLTPLLKQGHWGNLFQCLMSLTVQRRSFLFRWNLPCFSLSHCLLSCQWALLKIAWLYLLSSLPLDICMHWWHFPWIFSSPGYTVPVLPGFPHRRNAPLPSSSLWPFIGLLEIPVFFFNWGAWNWTKYSECGRVEGEYAVLVPTRKQMQKELA